MSKKHTNVVVFKDEAPLWSCFAALICPIAGIVIAFIYGKGRKEKPQRFAEFKLQLIYGLIVGVFLFFILFACEQLDVLGVISPVIKFFGKGIMTPKA